MKDLIQYAGTELLNNFPLIELPYYRKDVNWASRGVKNFGDVTLPDVNGNDCRTAIFELEAAVEYIEVFKKLYKEEPVFLVNVDAMWFEKIIVTNECFVNKQEEVFKIKSK